MTEAVLLVVVGNLRGGAVAGSGGHADFAAESRRAHERKGAVPAARKADSTDVHMLCFTGGRDGRFGRDAPSGTGDTRAVGESTGSGRQGGKEQSGVLHGDGEYKRLV